MREQLSRIHQLISAANSVRILKNLTFVGGSASFSQGYCCQVSSRSCSTSLERGYLYKYSIRIIDHNRSWGSFIEAAHSISSSPNTIAWNTVRAPSNGFANYQTDKPGSYLMNWVNSVKTPILSTGDILDVSVDLRHSSNEATFQVRGKENQRFTFTLESGVERFYLNISLWSQSGVMFVDPLDNVNAMNENLLQQLNDLTNHFSLVGGDVVRDIR